MGFIVRHVRRMLVCTLSFAATPLLTQPAMAELSSASCPTVHVAPLALGRFKDALAADREITIVALGSSSTEGARASNAGHSYPAVLQSELEAALPQAHIAVLNRGIAGQDVGEMLPRLERDALAIHPALVIWQVGANGAMRHSDPEVFRRLLSNGVQRLQESHVDVVLMDNQRAPVVLASPEHARIDQALADVAARMEAGLFSRGILMDAWQAAGFPYERFISEDGVHHNDFGYSCIAKALATAIVEGLSQTPGPVPVRSARR